MHITPLYGMPSKKRRKVGEYVGTRVRGSAQEGLRRGRACFVGNLKKGELIAS